SGQGDSAAAAGGTGPALLVLDELDSGIIICITHLAQVACHAHRHIRVAKAQAPAPGAASGSTQRVTTRFDALLTAEARVAEVAAMLGVEANVAAGMLMAAQP
ncbi:AAA_23 domain-containing protein, partial [Haematococcus lacustris]